MQNMKIWQKKILAAILIFTFFAACQHHDEGSRFSEEFDLAKIDGSYAEPPPLPTNLWSPAQKKAAATQHFLLGEYASLKGDFETSLKNFELAYSFDENVATAQKKLFALMMTQRPEEAFKTSEKFMILYPNSVKIRLLHSQLLVKQAEFEKALDVAKEAIPLDPKHEQTYLQIVTICRALKDKQQAELILKQLLLQNPSSLSGMTALAKLYIEDQRYEEAYAHIKKAFDLSPSHNHESYVLYSYLSLLLGKTAQSLSTFAEMVGKYPASEHYGERTLLLRRYFSPSEKLISSFEKLSAAAKKEDRFFIDLQRAFIYWKELDPRAGTNLILKLLKDEPASSQLLFLAGSGFEQQGDLEKARYYFSQIDAYSNYFITGQLKISRLQLLEKNWDGAIQTILELTHYPYGSWEVYYQGATLYAMKEKYEHGVRLLAAGVERFPSAVKLLFLKGVYTEKLGRIDETIQIMEQVIQKDPSHSSAYNYLGYIYAERGVHLEEAEQLILKALNLKPRDGFYLDSLGWVYYKQGLYEKAVATFMEALQQVPDEGVIMEHMAETLLAMNEKEKAYQFFDLALKHMKEEADKKRVEERLKKLKN